MIQHVSSAICHASAWAHLRINIVGKIYGTPWCASSACQNRSSLCPGPVSGPISTDPLQARRVLAWPCPLGVQSQSVDQNQTCWHPEPCWLAGAASTITVGQCGCKGSCHVIGGPAAAPAPASVPWRRRPTSMPPLPPTAGWQGCMAFDATLIINQLNALLGSATNLMPWLRAPAAAAAVAAARLPEVGAAPPGPDLLLAARHALLCMDAAFHHLPKLCAPTQSQPFACCLLTAAAAPDARAGDVHGPAAATAGLAWGAVPAAAPPARSCPAPPPRNTAQDAFPDGEWGLLG